MPSSSSSSLSAQTTQSNKLILPHCNNTTNNNIKKPIRYVMAPMVAASDYAFRRLVRRYGTELCFTQMLHARNVLKDDMFRRNHCDFFQLGQPLPNLLPSQQACLQGAKRHHGLPPPCAISEGECGPLIVQLAGHDADAMVQAATLLVRQHPNTIQGFDVNLGCPQGIARKGNYGAFLLERNTALACDVLTRLRQSSLLPPNITVSAKIRLPTSLTTEDLQHRMQKLATTGIDFCTIHGRTLEENKVKVRACHVDMIQEAVRMVDFPIVANGGMETLEDVRSILARTGAAAAMSSEGLLETPNLFAPAADNKKKSLSSPRWRLEQQLRFSREYLELAARFPPLPGVLGQDGGSFNIVRGHLFKFLHRYLQENIDLRDVLASHRTRNLGQAMDLLQELEGRYAGKSDTELQQCDSSRPGASWYRRHWKSSVSSTASAAGQLQNKREELTVEEHKRQMQERISKLRQQRLARESREASVGAGAAVETKRQHIAA